MENERSFFDSTGQDREIFIPSVSVDCIILGFHAGSLKILLCKFKVGDKWMIPGSFVRKDEDPDDSALRIIEEQAGIKDAYIRQFSFFGKKGRMNATETAEVFKRYKLETEEGKSYFTRLISLAYYSLVKYDDVRLSKKDYEVIQWFDVNEIPDLYADHREIVDKAMDTIRKQVGFVPIGFELLPEKFTMPELRGIYESILGRELDRRNFQRKMLSIGYIMPLNETRKMGAHKSPNLYTFIREKYDEAEKYGIQIMTSSL